jgi:hypothetical protein
VIAEMRRLAGVAFCALAAVVPSRVRAQAPAGQSEVMAAVKRMFDGRRAGDSAMVHSAFHPQLRMVSVGNGKDGKLRVSVEESPDGFLKAVGTPHPAVFDERIWNEKVQIDGPLASVWVDYAFYAGDKFSHCGIDHFLLIRGEEGAWKIISLADTRRTEGCKP